MILLKAFFGNIFGKISIGALLAVAIFAAIQFAEARHYRKLYGNELAWGNDVFASTRQASANPKLARADTAAQVAALGRGVDKLRFGLKTCTSTAQAAEQNDRARQATLEQQLRAAEADSTARAGVIDKLRASAAQPRPAGACEPSDTLKGIWR